MRRTTYAATRGTKRRRQPKPTPVRRLTSPLRARPVDDVVDDAVLLGLLRSHDEVALHVALDALKRLTGVLCHQLVRELADAQNFARMNVDVRRLPLQPAHGRLM